MLYEDDVTPKFHELYDILERLDDVYPESTILIQLRESVEELETSMYDVTQRLFYGS